MYVVSREPTTPPYSLPVLLQDTDLVLSNANRMLDAANKILSKESTGLEKTDELWMRNLGVWDRENATFEDYSGVLEGSHPHLRYRRYAHKLFPRDRYLPDLTFSNVTNHRLIDGGYYRTRGDKMVLIPNYHILDFYTTDIAAKLFNKEWYLPHLSFKILPEDKDRLLKLKHQYFLLNHQNLNIPKEIGNLVNLHSLGFIASSNYSHECEPATFPKEIGKLVNLKSLVITGFSCTAIPKEIGNLVNLKRLDLSNNNPRCIPEEITNLSNLTFLNLSSRFRGEQLQLSETQKRWIEGIDTVHL